MGLQSSFGLLLSVLVWVSNAKYGILPYNSSGSVIPVLDPYDFSFSDGAEIISNPNISIRSGDPYQNTDALAMTWITSPIHKIFAVAFDYQYVSGYTQDGKQQIGANFTLSLHGIAEPTNLYIIYESGHLNNYSYDHCNTCYSPPVRINKTNLNIDVSSDNFIFDIRFQNNDRNMQIALETLNITVYWT